MDKVKPILVKCTGGATAQLLALSNAIYLSNKLSRPFKIKYYPYSTGTYWPFSIEALLQKGESVEVVNTRGVTTNGLQSGDFIADFPLRRKSFSYERLLQVIHKMHLNSTLNILRGEVVISAHKQNLEKVKMRTAVVSGNFVPLINDDIFSQLSQRFDSAKLPNPFVIQGKKEEVVIHYRLGDMRKMPSRNSKFGGHGVVDPLYFRRILDLENIELSKTSIKLVSDEPEVGRKLLKDVGISVKIDIAKRTVWEDLQTISSAKIFIGSLSQFSFFGATVCAFNGGRIYLPSNIYGGENLKDIFELINCSYFNCSYLPIDHYIFKM